MTIKENIMQESFNELGEAVAELKYQIYLVFFKPVFDCINRMVRKYDR